MRQFYAAYPIGAKASHQLSWSHYVELLKIEDKLERSFYEQQCLLEHWSIPELKRQKQSSLYLRLASSKDKDGILQLARQGQTVEKPEDIIREPYILDFLQVPEPYHLSETELEGWIISGLQSFLLELRPMVLTRKNMLFCGNHEAAESTAVICSLLGSYKEHGINPREWLNDVIAKLPYYLAQKSEKIWNSYFPASGEGAG